MTNVLFVVVNGFPQSGKDTLADELNRLLQHDGYTGIKYSTITTCMSLATIAGWDGIKNEKTRVMLSELKDWYTKHFDGTFNEMVKMINCVPDHFVFTVIFAMIREPEEIQKIQSYCNKNHVPFMSVLVKNNGETHHGSHSDQRVDEYPYSHYVYSPKDNLPLYLERLKKFYDNCILPTIIKNIV